MATTSDVLRKLAEDDGNYIVRDNTGTPRLLIRDANGNDICTVSDVHFDSLREQSYLEHVGGKWRLNEAGKKAAHRNTS